MKLKLIQFTLSKLIKKNYFVALFCLIIIIVNYIGYHNCSKNIPDKLYNGALVGNVIAIIVISSVIALFTVNTSNGFIASETSSYWFTVLNTFLLLFLLITFVISAVYFNSCKGKHVTSTTVANNRNEQSNNSKMQQLDTIEEFSDKTMNGVLVLNIGSLFAIIIMVYIGFIYT